MPTLEDMFPQGLIRQGANQLARVERSLRCTGLTPADRRALERAKADIERMPQLREDMGKIWARLQRAIDEGDERGKRRGVQELLAHHSLLMELIPRINFSTSRYASS